jgi:hypothetical protein
MTSTALLKDAWRRTLVNSDTLPPRQINSAETTFDGLSRGTAGRAAALVPRFRTPEFAGPPS